jgi:hypothetical protein
MEKPIIYLEHPGKVIETGERFEHVMAISLDPRSGYKEGVARCIESREGDVAVSGYTDRSSLYKVKGDSLEKFELGERIDIKGAEEVISKLTEEGGDFLGLEDPDIFIDEKTGLMHLYFTMPVKELEPHKYHIHLGHAAGESLDSLEMTEPTLLDMGAGSAKELSVAPLNSKGVRLNLIESSIKEEDFTYSTVRIAIAEDMGKPWQFGETVFHPKEHAIPWIGGHASPGPLLPKSFIDIGENKMLGIMNGREANQKVDDKTVYGEFSVGLFIYDYEEGKIDWVSPERIIFDSEARTITFASQFVETKPGEGVLYAHVDDSFVRAYTLNAEGIKELLPK